ncbi:hypothetical protein ACFSTC_58300 [Nonomuraea ferruginea]
MSRTSVSDTKDMLTSWAAGFDRTSLATEPVTSSEASSLISRCSHEAPQSRLRLLRKSARPV